MVDLGPPDLAQHVHPGQHVETLSPAFVQNTLPATWRLENDPVKILSKRQHVLRNVDARNIILNPLYINFICELIFK